MAINDVFRSVATFLGPELQTVQWVWHYRQATGGVSDHAALNVQIEITLAAAFDDVKAHIIDNMVGNTLELLLFDPVLNEFNGVDSMSISSIVGTSIDDGYPMNVSPFVTFHTALPKSRGKKFLFGFDEDSAKDGALTVAALADLATFAARFDFRPIEGVNTYNPGNFDPITEVFRDWTGLTVGVGLFTGSQYRRLPGRGA